MKKTITIDAPSRRGDKTYSTIEYEYTFAKAMLDPSYLDGLKGVKVDYANSLRKNIDLVRIAEIVFMMRQGEQPEGTQH